ncbi:hypothetical protein BAU15_12385 [Enterococcus sp. JM4C]|uniref:Rgg family transcriptional regulator n=1 Tax=Candidatus Enterococcus huntleyi TaxID=1857217 RepID=UPI00137B6243|nr:hypothetical protein [Enterococcus sp. JM4C]KAF1296070.1 hypothetical protein BAU15_12385 [Enterococcus sp. JM4C]
MFILYLIIQTKAVAERLPEITLDKVTKKEIEIIVDYLSTIEDWGYFELAAYTNCLGFFDADYRNFQYNDVIRQFRKFKGLPKYQHTLIKFLANSIILEFDEANYERVLELLPILYDETTDSDYLKGRIYWKFFMRLYQSAIGNFEFDGSIAIETLRLLGYEEEAENLVAIETSVLHKIN